MIKGFTPEQLTKIAETIGLSTVHDMKPLYRCSDAVFEVLKTNGIFPEDMMAFQLTNILSRLLTDERVIPSIKSLVALNDDLGGLVILLSVIVLQVQTQLNIQPENTTVEHLNIGGFFDYAIELSAELTAEYKSTISANDIPAFLKTSGGSIPTA